MSDSTPNFGEFLSISIKKNNYSISRLADQSNIPHKTIEAWLEGRVKRPRDFVSLITLASILDLSRDEVDELLSLSGHPSIDQLTSSLKSRAPRLYEKWKLQWAIEESVHGKVSQVDRSCAFCGKKENQVKRLIPGNTGFFICDECAARSVETLAQEGIKVRIARTIEFTPEYYQAGISILNYFGTVLREKHAELKAKVRIEQDDLKVTLVIESATGEQEKIEQTLSDFGLVIQGHMTAEEFLGDKLKALELKQHLRMAQLQIEHQRELYMLAQKQYDTRVKSLEEQVTWLNSHIGNILHYSKTSTTTLSITKVNTEGGIFLQGNANSEGDFIARDSSSIDVS